MGVHGANCATRKQGDNIQSRSNGVGLVRASPHSSLCTVSLLKRSSRRIVTIDRCICCTKVTRDLPVVDSDFPDVHSVRFLRSPDIPYCLLDYLLAYQYHRVSRSSSSPVV